MNVWYVALTSSNFHMVMLPILQQESFGEQITSQLASKITQARLKAEIIVNVSAYYP